MEETFVLQVLHAADQEAGLADVDDIINFSAIIDGLDQQFANTLRLSSGDIYIPGPFFAASQDIYGQPGVADILINNALGFQAVALGNHEFDFGPQTLANLIKPNPDITGPGIGAEGYLGTAFPFLAANLDFSEVPVFDDIVVADGQAPLANTIARSVVIDVNGEPIGIVGAVTPTLPTISSVGDVRVRPADSTDIDALAAETQPAIDELKAQGINKIIFMGHMQQLQVEEQLAERLRGVDIIIAGGSDSILANPDDPLRDGDVPVGPYPLVRTSPTGDPVYILNTDANYKYVGQLVAEFDANGVITAILAESGAYATDLAGVARVYGLEDQGFDPRDFADPAIIEITQAIVDETFAKEANVFGLTNVFLNGARISVRSEETNLGNLTADANLAIAQTYDPTVAVSIKNSGGIRDSIGVAFIPAGGLDDELVQLPPQAIPGVKAEGQISQLDIENALRFNNGLALLTVTATELRQILEHGVAGVAPGATPGSFPQVSGLIFSFDPDQTAIQFSRDDNQRATGVMVDGERVRSLALVDEAGEITDLLVQDGEIVGDPNREIRLVTLDFLASGGDAYPFALFGQDRLDLLDVVPPSGNLATFAPDGSEQDALAEYLFNNFPADGDVSTAFNQADTPITEDTRIQNLSFREDSVIPDSLLPPMDGELPGIGDRPLLDLRSIQGQITLDFALNPDIALDRFEDIYAALDNSRVFADSLAERLRQVALPLLEASLGQRDQPMLTGDTPFAVGDFTFGVTLDTTRQSVTVQVEAALR
ncbi:bifunctional metallophosphatase/5'-nucleotidase [Nodosilinea sp. P-1105]|uniref:bifunctional metallophosphatase/5'-nucleotidase n=1 Tax=Nodosilinea sp. P-1105 TaxID=2546229 RepID=UPI00146A76AC|nr:bifunctional metallophosphatase/5'-nucleotidase [Nodosilinea sp. P-1105]NMF81747.1 bifunctional metallophosphatase/5'-nucleotidase [Nodosilinea sp. P-1105]